MGTSAKVTAAGGQVAAARRPRKRAAAQRPATPRVRAAANRPSTPRLARIVEDDTCVRSAEHAAQDAYLLDIVERLVA